MDTVSTYETSVNFYETTRCNIPEHSHLHNRRRENLKSHTVVDVRQQTGGPDKSRSARAAVQDE
jgi:hypothetical protein